MNKIWEKIIVLMKNELYEKQNPKLLDLLSIGG